MHGWFAFHIQPRIWIYVRSRPGGSNFKLGILKPLIRLIPSPFLIHPLNGHSPIPHPHTKRPNVQEFTRFRKVTLTISGGPDPTAMIQTGNHILLRLAYSTIFN